MFASNTKIQFFVWRSTGARKAVIRLRAILLNCIVNDLPVQVYTHTHTHTQKHVYCTIVTRLTLSTTRTVLRVRDTDDPLRYTRSSNALRAFPARPGLKSTVHDSTQSPEEVPSGCRAMSFKNQDSFYFHLFAALYLARGTIIKKIASRDRPLS